MRRLLLIICGVSGISCQALQPEGISDINTFEKRQPLDERRFARQSRDYSKICLTPECVFAASSILKNMDTTVDPCDNFYKFACGSFIANKEIPDAEIEVSTRTEVTNAVLSKLRTALTSDKMEDLKTFRNMKNVYDICMNESLIEQQGKVPLRRLLNKLGGWPVVLGDKWSTRSFNWLDTSVKRRQLGLTHSIFLNVALIPDLTNSSRLMIFIDEATLRLPRSRYTRGINDPALKAYLQYMVHVAVLLGADKHRATKELTDALKFEIKLALLTTPIEERRNLASIYHPMTIQELAKTFPPIKWKKFINKIMDVDAEASDDDVVNVGAPSYIMNLLNLLKSTPKRVQANYAMWRVVTKVANLLTKDLRNAELAFAAVVDGQTKREPRWSECMSTVNDGIPLGAGALFVRTFFQKNVKNDVVELVKDIREAFKDILLQVEWMDTDTKENALKKAAAMVAHVAYPDELLDNTKLENYHANFTIHRTNYLEAVQYINKFSMTNMFKMYGKPMNKTDWIAHGEATTRNAFYNIVENSIEFPAGYLQTPLFNKDLPKYMNYGAVGFIIGHEITHGFDDQGRNFNADGNMVDWWSPSAQSKFLQKVQCIIEQYGNYTVKEIGMNVNAINTQGENIADNGGIKGAYLAYRKWVSRNGNEPQLPAVNYTSQQTFWLSTANSWCIKQRPDRLKQLLLGDTHSPSEFRINGMFSNRPEFAEDFNCPLGTMMNPETKCSVW